MHAIVLHLVTWGFSDFANISHCKTSCAVSVSTWKPAIIQVYGGDTFLLHGVMPRDNSSVSFLLYPEERWHSVLKRRDSERKKYITRRGFKTGNKCFCFPVSLNAFWIN